MKKTNALWGQVGSGQAYELGIGSLSFERFKGGTQVGNRVLEVNAVFAFNSDGCGRDQHFSSSVICITTIASQCLANGTAQTEILRGEVSVAGFGLRHGGLLLVV